jgi:hypothetical protein
MLINNKDKIIELYHKYKQEIPTPTKVPLSNLDLIVRPSPTTTYINKYQSIIGALNYIAQRTRPDIMIYVHKLAKFMRNPTVHQLSLAFKIISYLNNTANYNLIYKNVSNFSDQIVVYSDSDFYGKECFDGKATTGCIVYYRDMPILWKAKKQENVSDEICYAELYAINYSMKKSIAIKNIMFELKMIKDEKIAMNVDSSAAKSIAERTLGSKSKHYEISLLYVNDFIHRGELEIKKITSEQNVADAFTKFITNKLFYQHRVEMKVEHVSNKELRKRN